MAAALAVLRCGQAAARTSLLLRASASALALPHSQAPFAPAAANALLSVPSSSRLDGSLSSFRGLITLPFSAIQGAAAYGPSAAARRPISSSVVPPQSQEPFSSNPLHQPTTLSGEAEASTTRVKQGPREAFCYLRRIPMSPSKLNMAAKLVRGMHIQDAMIQMDIRGVKKSAKFVKDALKSAYFNAINNHSLDADKLKVAECFVGKGRHLKRTMIHGMGRSAMMLKKRSHLTVKLVEDDFVIRQTRVVKPLLERATSTGK